MHTPLRPMFREVRVAVSVVSACFALGCSPTSADPDPIECPEGAEPELIRFDEGRMGFDPDVLSAVGWRCLLPSGERHGTSQEWFANGQPSAVTEWWQGEKHGRFEMWHSNGQKRAEGEHHRWQAVGLWRNWDRDGNLLQEKDFGPPVESPAVASEPAADDADVAEAGPAATEPSGDDSTGDDSAVDDSGRGQ